VDIGQGRQYDAPADGRFQINTALDAIAPITPMQNRSPEGKK